LMDAGGTVNAETLNWAARNGQEEIVKFLLGKNVNVKASSKALLWAVRSRDEGTVRALLQKGARVSGEALEEVAGYGPETIVRLLLDKEVNVTKRALALANMRQDKELFHLMERKAKNGKG